jgi:phosphoglycerol transferase
LWARHHGKNTEVVQRTIAEVEQHGLHAAQLFLPGEVNRLTDFTSAGREARATPVAEDDAYLGIPGAIGLLAALVVVLSGALGARTRPIRPEARFLSTVAVAALLFAVVGGGGVLIAVAGFSAVRTWSRMLLFIALGALGTLALLLQDALDRAGPRVRIVAAAALVALLPLALLDLIPRHQTPSFEPTAIEERSDIAFVRAMESALPDRAMVFQLPFLAFPEGGRAGDIADYVLLKGYVWGSGRLRWSYGAVRGRESDWQERWGGEDPAQVVQAVAAAGFSALYVDRYGYGDRGAALDAAVRPFVGGAAGQSADERLRWYDLRPLRKALVSSLGDDVVRTAATAVITSVAVEFAAGVEPIGADGGARGGGRVAVEGTVRLERKRPGSQPLELSLLAVGPEGATLTASTAGASTTVALSPQGTPLRVTVPRPGAASTVRLVVGNAAPSGVEIRDVVARDPAADLLFR